MVSWAWSTALALLIAHAVGGSYAYPEIFLHELSLEELQHPSDATLERLRDAVFNHGMFIVRGSDPDTVQPFNGALAQFEQCAISGDLDELMLEVELPDGTTRKTLATATNESVPQEFSNDVQTLCPTLPVSSEGLRKSVDATGLAYAAVLDSLLHSDPNQKGSMHQRRPFSDAVRSGESLEHFHLFEQGKLRSSGNVASPEESDATLPLHTDMGLFIVMTAAEYFNSQGRLPEGGGKPDVGFLLELPGGQRVKPNIPDGSLLVMNGEASHRWMWSGREAKDLSAPLPYAPGHEMTVPDLDGVVRAWFGRMYFPPRASVLHTDSSLTFGEYRQQTHAAFREGNPHLASSLGCSPHVRRLADEGSCASDEVYCWMQCMPVSSDLTCDKSSMLCTDPRGQVWPDDFINPGTGEPDHCFDCALECPVPEGSPRAPPSPPPSGFCNNNLVPISMWMTGFQFTGKSSNPCIVYLFPEWVLDTKVKFAFACIGTVLMGIATIALSYAIGYLRKGRKPADRKDCKELVKATEPCCGTDNDSSHGSRPGVLVLLTRPQSRWMRLLRDCVIVLLYGIQMTFAYWLMLLAMTYQAEVFIMTVTGLMIGFWIFNLYLDDEHAENPDPCCA